MPPITASQVGQEQVVAASGNILRGVYAPAYLQKLAELGHVAKTAQEAEELLELGFKLENAAANAPSSQSKYASAVSALDGVSHGPSAVADYQLKQAAAQLAQDPAIYASAAVLQEAEKSIQ